MAASTTWKAWGTCLSCAIFLFYAIVHMSLFNVIGPDLIETLKIDATELSHLSASYLIANALSLIPVGLLYDRVSSRQLLLLSSFCVASSTFLLISFNHYSIIWSAHAVAGIGNSFAFLGCMRLTPLWFSRQTALMIGLVISIGLSGGVFAQIILGSLSLYLSWKILVAGVGIFGFIVWLCLYLFLVESDHDKKTSTIYLPQLLHTLKQVAVNPYNSCSAFYISLMNMPVFVLTTLWSNLILTKAYGFSIQEASITTAMIFVGLIVGSPTVGFLSDKIGSRRKVMLLGAIVAFIVALIIVMLESIPVIYFMGLYFLLGFFISTQVIGYTVINEHNPTLTKSLAMGFTATIVNMLGAMGIPVFGWLIETQWNGIMSEGVPVYLATDYQFALWFFPTAFLLSMFFLLRMKEKAN